MQRLLIVGCGDVMRRALPLLLPHWRVYALLRHGGSTLQREGVTVLHGDLDQPSSLRRLSGWAHAVIHSAPPPPPTAAGLHHALPNSPRDMRTRHLLAALTPASRAGSLPRRLVYISTSGVYGDCQGARVTETRPPQPTTLRAQRRLDAERQLRAFGAKSGCAVSILRAPGIYAQDRLPLERLAQGTPVLCAAEDVYTNHIHADDLARACVAALHLGRPNRIVNVCDGVALKMGDWYDALATAYHLQKPPRLPRSALATQLSPLTLSFMSESRRLDNTRLRRELRLQLHYPDPRLALPQQRSERP